MNPVRVTVNPTGEENPDHAYKKSLALHDVNIAVIDNTERTTGMPRDHRDRATGQREARRARR